MDYKIKETLKKEHIEQDIKNSRRPLIIAFIIIVPFFILGFFLAIYAGVKNGFNILVYSLLIYDIVIIYICTRKLIMDIIAYIHCDKNYIIVLDKLVNMGMERVYSFRNGHIGFLESRCFYFWFQVQKGGFYVDRTRTYYIWSNLYNMIGHSLINSSYSGEDFYLVLVNTEIVSVYNKKMFELSDELTLSPNRKL